MFRSGVDSEWNAVPNALNCKCVIRSGNMQIIPVSCIMVVDLAVLIQREIILIYSKVHNLFLSFIEIIK